MRRPPGMPTKRLKISGAPVRKGERKPGKRRKPNSTGSAKALRKQLADFGIKY